MRAGNRTKFCRLAIVGALAMGGCAGLERFAPPGIVKYEDLAKGQPPSEAIKARVAEAKQDGPARFPNLSRSPQKAPKTLSPKEQAELELALKDTRSALGETVAADRQSAGVAEAADLEAARDALRDLVAADDAAARTERGLPPRPAPQPQ